MADQRAQRQRVQLQRSVSRHLENAQHGDRTVPELAARRGHQLALRQHEALLQQRRIGRGRQRRRPKGRAHHGGFQHGGEPGDLPCGEEIVPHEPLDAVLPAVPGVAHAGADHRLQVEGQAILGAAGDIVQMEAHGP